MYDTTTSRVVREKDTEKPWQFHLPPSASAPTTKIMVALRLTRQGSKDRPYYKIVAVDSRTRRDGRYIEQLGTYNPMVEGENYTLDLEKADKWLGVGAKPSGTVASIIKKVRKAS
ncbi:MAG: small subunit ribosomal protein S16 [Paracoccaceae bacterium]